MRKISKAFGDKRVIRDFDIAITPGSHQALLGPSGCGKTTLLKIASGLTKADSGMHTFPGKGSISWVFQESRLLPWLNVRENLEYILPQTLGRADRTGLIDSLLEMMDLSGHGSHFPRELSGGMARRIALARALAPEAEVIFLDEPFTGLNPELRWKIAEKTFDYCRKRSKTVLWVTHDEGLAADFSDDIHHFGLRH